MNKVELLLPAGNIECLRAAVNNGADAVYFGLNKFNARASAGNINKEILESVVDYCHERNVRVYITFNTLVKNDEIKEYLELIGVAYRSHADAVIIQDPCLIPLIKENFPSIKIHLSTQANNTNSYSVPEGVDRVILARELDFDEIKSISKKYKTEVFVHGALCFCYSGLCLFSSLAGGRSGNRGRCAQPCRLKYNNKYPLSTMDLCMIDKLPEIIEMGVKSIKVEGRLRSATYVGTVAKIYRKYIDLYYSGKFKIDFDDVDELKIAFNREFTHGFAYSDNIVDDRMPMNRGLFIGVIKDGKIKLEKNLKKGDGIGIWKDDKVSGHKVSDIIIDKKHVNSAKKGDTVDIGLKEDGPVYKTSSVDIKVDLGDEINTEKMKFDVHVKLPKTDPIQNKDDVKIFVKVYNLKSAIEAEDNGADVIYYDIYKPDFKEVQDSIIRAKVYAFTPRVLSDEQLNEVVSKIDKLKPDGLLVGNRGLLKMLKGKDIDLHLDYSLNCFNDVDLNCYHGIPIISPELNFNEVVDMKNKNIIVLVHGDIVLMTTKQKMKMPELIDDDGRHFRVREYNGNYEILNYVQIGLFSKCMDYLDKGIKYYYIDLNKDVGKFVRVYKKIFSGEPFDDKKIRKGYTKGHLERGVQ